MRSLHLTVRITLPAPQFVRVDPRAFLDRFRVLLSQSWSFLGQYARVIVSEMDVQATKPRPRRRGRVFQVLLLQRVVAIRMNSASVTAAVRLAAHRWFAATRAAHGE
jgi:hypothetical protein